MMVVQRKCSLLHFRWRLTLQVQVIATVSRKFRELSCATEADHPTAREGLRLGEGNVPRPAYLQPCSGGGQLTVPRTQLHTAAGQLHRHP